MRSLVHWANGTALLAIVLGGAAAYGRLPDRIPTHFTLGGVPDEWAARTSGQWFLLAGIAVLTTVFLYATAEWVKRRPERMNVPDQRRFEALPPEGRAEVVAFVLHGLYWVNFLALSLFGAIMLGAYLVAVGAADRLPWYVLAVEGVVFVASLLGGPLMIWRLAELVRRLERRYDPS